ncbi:hypothetical protein D9M71_647370 [compost metagenome]
MDGMADVADAQPAFLATAQALAQRFQALGMFEQATRLGQEGAPVAGQVQALVAPFEQRQAKVVLQLGDLPAEGRLGNMQLLGGPADVLAFGDGHEVAQLT